MAQTPCITGGGQHAWTSTCCSNMQLCWGEGLAWLIPASQQAHSEQMAQSLVPNSKIVCSTSTQVPPPAYKTLALFSLPTMYHSSLT
eukprot:1161992-Pelagomonas_calceolata.AAC.4